MSLHPYYWHLPQGLYKYESCVQTQVSLYDKVVGLEACRSVTINVISRNVLCICVTMSCPHGCVWKVVLDWRDSLPALFRRTRSKWLAIVIEVVKCFVCVCKPQWTCASCLHLFGRSTFITVLNKVIWPESLASLLRALLFWERKWSEKSLRPKP